ncbi:MAG: hypothetical protein JXA25_19205 [Anaerolineales bacterium]|nr:hypothetical protein [Anaerolineales bacterium]
MQREERIISCHLYITIVLLGLVCSSFSNIKKSQGDKWGETDECQPTCLGNQEEEVVNREWEETSANPPEAGDTFCIECNDDFRCYLFEFGRWRRTYWARRGRDDFVNGVCVDDLPTTYPCETLSISRYGTLTCGGAYAVSASAQVPCVQVKRWPYPRGLVNLENTFEVARPYVSQRGVGQSAGWCSPGIRNYTLEVEWRMVGDVQPVWSFDEREWAEEPEYQRGFVVTHTYQTSSWAKPENGPSLEGKLELPAYQVELGTAWQPYLRRSWEERVRERKELDCSGCGSSGECEELCSKCGSDGTDREADACYEERWEARTTGWQAVDLRAYGYTESYYRSWLAGDISEPPEDIPSVPVEDRVCGSVPVPVIEVQVYLNAP